MSTPFLGEIRIISWNYPPRGWAFCNGQLLPINQNQALFSLLGTTYGGNGQTNFALPNLQGRVPVHMGNGFSLGQQGGEITHTIIQSEMPAHTHVPVGSSNAADQGVPAGNYWALESSNAYATQPDSALHPASVTNIGGSQPHTNLSPFLVLNYCIALLGIFPSQT
jgi:microcystin-dependent protein